MRGATILFCVCLLYFSMATSSHAKRVALVVGSDAYVSLPRLHKAVNDARAVGEALRDLQFTVLIGENLTRRELNRKLSDLEAMLSPGDEVFFFYAGHGVALGSENYLLPTDMPMPRSTEESLVRNEGHSVDAILRSLQGRGAGITLVVLDACRNNPFAEVGTRNIGLSRGLTRMDTPSGVFVLFSAGIGQTALDRLSEGDPDPNSVFTRRLIPLLKVPGLTHVDLAKQVQQQVNELAATVNHDQQPAYYDQIIGTIVLRPRDATAATDAGESTISVEAEAWNTIKESKSVAILEAYLERVDGTIYAAMAGARIEELRRQQQETKDGEAQIASLEPQVPTTEVVLAPVNTDQSSLVRSIQTELSRMGCYTHQIDGLWGSATRQAIQRLNSYAKLNLAIDQPTAETINALTGDRQLVCPVECPKGHVISSGACVNPSEAAIDPSSGSVDQAKRGRKETSKSEGTKQNSGARRVAKAPAKPNKKRASTDQPKPARSCESFDAPTELKEEGKKLGVCW
jgi:hypothetical protein